MSTWIIRPDFQNSTEESPRFFIQNTFHIGRNVIAENLTLEQAKALIDAKKQQEHEFDEMRSLDAELP